MNISTLWPAGAVQSALNRSKPYRMLALLMATGFGLALAVFGGFLLNLHLSGNFHAVYPGELYRSAEPTAARLQRYQKKFGIRTVINLLGPRPGVKWYDAEVRQAAGLGLKHIDFRMSATQMISPERMRELVEIMRAAEKPILVHCRSGSDRSGLASALYLAAIKHVDPEAAESQMSIAYGHFDNFLSPTQAMDDSFETYEPYLASAARPATQ